MELLRWIDVNPATHNLNIGSLRILNLTSPLPCAIILISGEELNTHKLRRSTYEETGLHDC